MDPILFAGSCPRLCLSVEEWQVSGRDAREIVLHVVASELLAVVLALQASVGWLASFAGSWLTSDELSLPGAVVRGLPARSGRHGLNSCLHRSFVRTGEITGKLFAFCGCVNRPGD